MTRDDDRENGGTINGICFDKMRLTDIPAVARIECEAFSQPWTEKGFEDTLSQEYAIYLVAKAKETGEIAGYCGLLQSLDEAELLNVAVRRDQRGRGIGYVMVAQLMALGRERGVRRFTLEVRKGNEAALRLYRKLGFVPAGIRRSFYVDPVEDAVIMCTE